MVDVVFPAVRARLEDAQYGVEPLSWHAGSETLELDVPDVRRQPFPFRGAGQDVLDLGLSQQGGQRFAESPPDGRKGGHGGRRHVPLDRADRGGGHAAFFRHLLEREVLLLPDALYSFAYLDRFHVTYLPPMAK